MATPNTYANVSSLANPIQEDALFVIRERYQVQNLVTTLTDMSGLNPRKGYQYNQAAATDVGESDDLTSSAFAPSLLATLTPSEIGLQFFITDSRADSDLPENIVRDGALELGLAAGDKIETDLLGEFASLTGGTVGTAGSTITWGYVAAAISQARNANKSANVPLAGVVHGYQAAVLAKSASVAGATLAQAPNFTDNVTRNGLGPVFVFMGVPIYQVFGAPDASDDFRGAVFPPSAIAMDWRRMIRVEPERDASRRGTEFNMSAVYAHGVWRANLGVQMIFDASAPTS
jgi:hypothetical protein